MLLIGVAPGTNSEKSLLYSDFIQYKLFTYKTYVYIYVQYIIYTYTTYIYIYIYIHTLQILKSLLYSEFVYSEFIYSEFLHNDFNEF